MRIRHFLAFILLASAILLLPCRLKAQTAAEEPVIKSANTYFENGDYPAAMPLYSQLLSNHRDDANYNYRYGVCVLFASTEKEKGLKYLENASKSPGVEVDVWFYLGKAYHLNYQFEQAITAYTKYKTLAGPKKAEKLQVDNQIAMCKTGRKLLKAITDITVLDKAELNQADFFRRYDLRGAGYSGQLLVKPDEFKTALDKKKNEQSIIFLSGEKTELYFASYGEDESQGKDIYVVRKLPNGNWGKPQNVGYPVNTEYDEDFPFLHPNGKVLYFSSKGHNSMGGYDIFRAEKNEDVGTWQKPANLDFAINSPDDDVMFVSDLDEKTAWFASNRSSPEGKMTVYHVVIERKPVNMCLIAGTFTPTPGDPNRGAKITVKNAETNEPLGVYKSNEATGKYLVNLPNNGGKYTFTVDHSGIATQTETVFIPPQYQIKTLNQQVGYNEVNNESKLFILTDFDADTSMLDPSFLKDKAKLDIYNETPGSTQVVDMGQLPGTLPEAGGVDSGDANDPDEDSADVAVDEPGNPPTKVRNEELVKSANEDAASTQQEAIELKSQKEKAWTNAAAVNEEAKSKTAEAKAAKTAAEALPDGPDKIAALQNADKLTAEANALQAQASFAISIAQALDNDAKQKQQEADKATQYATSLDKAVKTNDPKALDAAIALGSELEAMSDTRAESAQTAKNLQEEADKKNKELEKAKTSAQDLREEIVMNEERITQLRTEQAKEKDPDLKAQIDTQIEGINEDIADNKTALAAADKKVATLQNQFNELDNQAKGAEEALAQSKNPAVTGSVLSAEEKKAMGQDAIAYQQGISDDGATRTYAPVNAGTSTVATSGTQTSNDPVSTTQTGTQTGSQPTTAQTTTTQTGSEPSTAQTTASTNTQPGTRNPEPGTVTSDDSDNVVVADPIDPDIAFTSSIQNSDTITDPVAREKAKAAVYSDWAASIDDQIKEKKQELAGTTDKTKKTELNNELKALQASKTQKEKEAKNSLAAADKEEKAQLANRPAQPAVASEQFTSQLTAADAKSSEAERENAKAQVYNDWADSLDAAATVKENGLPKIRDKKQQEKVKQEIAALRTEASDKRTFAEDAKSKATAAEAASQPVATTTTTSTGAANTSANTATDKINYTDPSANNALAAQQNLLTAAEANKTKKDSLTALAGAADGAEKTQLLKAATEQQRQAWDKEAQASAKLGEADKIQFDKNQQELSRYEAAAPANSDDPNVLVAALLTGEAKTLFEKAKQERDSANATTNNFIKTEALRNAEENEAKGLQKQQQALALYQKSGIEPGTQSSVASTTQTGSQSTTTQTTGTQTGSDPSTTQTTGTQTGYEPTTTQTTGTQTGSEPTTTQTTGTQTGTEPTTTQTTGTQTGFEPTTTQTTGTQTGTEPTTTQTSGTQTGSDPSTTQTTGTQTGSEPSTTQTTGTQTGSQPTTAQTTGTQTSSEPSTTQTTGTQTGTEPTTTQTTGTQTANTQPGTRNSEPATEVINPSTGQPLTSTQLSEVRRTDAYKNYLDANTEALASDREAAAFKTEAEQFQSSADKNVARAQDLAVQAADENDRSKKQQLLDESKRYNEAANQNMASRDSVTELADAAEMNANANRNKSKSILQELDPQTAEQVKAVATADLPGNPSTARTGSQPTTTQTSTAQTGSEPSSTQTSTTQSGAEPTSTQPSSTQTTGTQTGSEPSSTQTSTTQTTGSQPGSEPSTTQTTGTQTGSEPSSTQPTTTQTTSTNSQPGTQNPKPGTQNSVTTRLAPGEELKLAAPSATVTAAAPTIVTNPSLPEGLVYKVQIGAFRNPISAEIYKGISPVTAETTASGLTRYTAGLFKQFANADAAKAEIRALGYKDAFVVAFYNGKRISVDEARRMSGEPAIASASTGTTPATTGTQPASSTTQNSTTGTAPETATTTTTSNPNAARTTDVKELKGLFYTVQVGVYKNEVSKAKLKNLPDLVNERANGFIRYSSGKYCTPEAAGAAKQNAVDKGIPDAFVTAYYNGKRISVSEAKALEATGVSPCQGTTTPTASQPTTTQPTTTTQPENRNTPPTTPQPETRNTSPETIPTTTTTQSSTQNSQPETQNTEHRTRNPEPETQNSKPETTLTTIPPVPTTGLVFSVQIGAFREEVPVEIANQFLQLASKGVKNYLDPATGLTVYQFGVCLTKEEAETFRAEAVKVGITDAFIVAFSDGKKITMEEAMELGE